MKGQDTSYYWGNSLTDKNNYNRYTITKKHGKCFTTQNFYKKGGSWIKSSFIDSVCIESEFLILKFKKHQNKLFDFTKLKIEHHNDIFEIAEYYDNDVLKFNAFSSSNYPFNFNGNAKQFYRNGKLYANYYYSNNHIDSIKVSNQDTTFRQLAAQSHNIYLQEKAHEIARSIMKHLKVPMTIESSIVSTFIFGLCIEKGKISRIEILRRTDFEFDNALIKAIEKVDCSKILDSNISGCVIFPLRVDYQ